MNAHERQQFDMLLQMAVDRYAERLVQRNDGPEQAHVRLRDTPDAEGVWLSGFVDAVFQDSLLDNTAGACFVLEALERRPVPAPAGDATSAGAAASSVGDLLARVSRQAFAALLRQKTLEELARRSSYQAVRTTES